VLVRDDGILIGQPAHAWVAGQIARAWAADLPHRRELELAAIQHDIGWQEYDLAPKLAADGKPIGFMQTPLADHLEIWTGAPQRLLSQSRIAALCVSLHGTKLYGRRDLSKMSDADADAVRAYLDGQAALQARLREQTGVTAEEAAAMQDVLFCWDWLALALCLDWAPSSFRDELELRDGTVTPWPFAADAVTFACEGWTYPADERVPLEWTLTRAPSAAP
jgi:hypothetical protein